MSLLRESFAGINARFHLVGVTSLLGLLLPMALSAAGKREEWSPALVAGFFVASGIAFAIQGLVYHAATNDARNLKPSGWHLGLQLFPTLLWLQVKLLVLCFVPLLVGALAWQGARASGPPTETALREAEYWIAPFAETAILILTTVATPLAIWLREHGRRGRPIIDGVRFFAHRGRDTAVILALLLPAAIVGGTIDYLRGPALDDPVPRMPEALAMILTSYLTLVALFAACRVMGRAAAAPPAVNADRAGRPADEDSRGSGQA